MSLESNSTHHFDSAYMPRYPAPSRGSSVPPSLKELAARPRTRALTPGRRSPHCKKTSVVVLPPEPYSVGIAAYHIALDIAEVLPPAVVAGVSGADCPVCHCLGSAARRVGVIQSCSPVSENFVHSSRCPVTGLRLIGLAPMQRCERI